MSLKGDLCQIAMLKRIISIYASFKSRSKPSQMNNSLSKVAFLVIIQLLIFQLLFAQSDSTKIPKGAQADWSQIAIFDAEMVDLLMPVMPGVGTKSRNLLEEKSIKPYMMPPRKIGEKGELYAYSLATLLEYYVNFDNNFKDNLSPDYISLSTQNKNLEAGLKFLATNGTVSAAIMPYEATTISTAVYATNKYKIRQFLQIFADDNDKNRKIFETRKALMRGNPILISIGVDERFLAVKGIKYWHKIIKKPTLEVTMIVVGYNHDLEGFELMGNWGSEWADNGYIFMDYEDYGRLATAGVVIVPDRNFLD